MKNCLFVGCLTSQQHASLSQGRKGMKKGRMKDKQADRKENIIEEKQGIYVSING